MYSAYKTCGICIKLLVIERVNTYVLSTTTEKYALSQPITNGESRTMNRNCIYS